MLVNLKDIFVGGAPITIGYAMDLSKEEVPGGGFPFSEPVRVSGRIENRAGVVQLHAAVHAVRHTVCDRCLSPISQPMHVEFENVLVTESQGDDSDELLVCSEQTLDMDALAKTNLFLSLPMKELCRPNCKGICPQCGKNLNDGPCGCKPQGHPAFLKLREFLQ
ncbi:YceD family protein [Ethanoligenens harbinense]|uniref:DUF177 domain-containing protein n=1 Tax=Ethanoligenens harbinense (strain DSM 18485 / JCM 12961 / CGMCC 1.5033 / YUAN-3) TaxID=663278 RepID=E6U4Z6_ETHHY|nr:DUF177 domain-containing protein [Ethanoligenens harbinense]ADU26702.1 protein of unknown function DUF177 [Ethanoligenens harbinense YUAN-3]AVQ95817.1 DUF177 domain-containing protein [Ethanoligenens harbinense YUAN-3]AYF38478.1 DUF177 domain-containing protein [Ethanoligenens harbinense]AYF41224.1 DUF177 domain-containing protein [Ethanoligenens harbinense]QCN92057.1 DUF177 domain-containing protein [Ethanoligenens harbinense]